TLPRVLFALDLDLSAGRVPIANAGQLANGALVREPRDFAGLEALPEAPVELGLEVRVPLPVARPLPHVHRPHWKTEVVQVLREVVADPGRIDVHDVEAVAVGCECRDNGTSWILVRPGVQTDDPLGLTNDQHRLVLARPGHVEARGESASAVGDGTAGG